MLTVTSPPELQVPNIVAVNVPEFFKKMEVLAQFPRASQPQ
jgi:hypothetical protein